MNILDSIKKSLILFYIGLPLILISTLLFLGVGLGNAGLLFLSAGHLFLVPMAVMVLHMATQFLPEGITTIKYNDIGTLVPSQGILSGTTINVFPSYWISHLTFFCTYIFFNAYTVYKLESPSDDPSIAKKVSKRKSRSAIIMLFTLFTFIAFIGIRYKVTRVETFVGMLGGIGLMGGLGYGWYVASGSINIKTMDIFGIVQRMSSVTDTDAKTLCVSQN